jgi:hypothetical protein
LAGCAALIRLMDIKSEPDLCCAASVSEVSQFDDREMTMAHRMFRRAPLLTAGVVRQVSGRDVRRAHPVDTVHAQVYDTS